MRKAYLLIVTFFVISAILSGCNSVKDRGQEVPIGDLILNQEKITSVQITEVEGPANISSVTLTDPSDIGSMVAMVRAIPVKRLTEEEEQAFSPTRIMEKHLTIEFDDNMNPSRTIQGFVFIWPDGYILTADIETMTGSTRTISYLSECRYPEIYTSVYEKIQH